MQVITLTTSYSHIYNSYFYFGLTQFVPKIFVGNILQVCLFIIRRDKETTYDLTEGVFLSSHGAPSNKGVHLETHLCQVYTAQVFLFFL